MPTNVEIKARLSDGDVERVRALAEERATAPTEWLRQRDTFYRVTSGRLKLREFGDGAGELIAYDRADRAGPKTSRYVVAPCPDPKSLHAALDRSVGTRGIVAKQREVIHVGQTRVHLDAVEGLGSYLELEVVLRDGQSIRDGEAIAADLMARFGVGAEALVECAYIDLLESGERV